MFQIEHPQFAAKFLHSTKTQQGHECCCKISVIAQVHSFQRIQIICTSIHHINFCQCVYLEILPAMWERQEIYIIYLCAETFFVFRFILLIDVPANTVDTRNCLQDAFYKRHIPNNNSPKKKLMMTKTTL